MRPPPVTKAALNPNEAMLLAVLAVLKLDVRLKKIEALLEARN
jgi:hypothetical protein